MVKLLVFLGNPGKEYERTRHNVGWMACAHAFPSAVWTQKFHGLIAQTQVFRLLKPMTYMNASGLSVQACASYYQYNVQQILVIHDDLELPFGTVRLQAGGGLAGHNGLKSIKEQLGSDQFLRLRIGIGRPPFGSVSAFVLQRFTKDEEISLSVVLNCIDSMLKEDFTTLPVTNTLV
jgi:PTH1 family peptidyl-tRNA hydrolase